VARILVGYLNNRIHCVDFREGEELEVNYLNAAQKFGATHTLVKPLDPAELIALIRRSLEDAPHD
jgi:hypothetical protein